MKRALLIILAAVLFAVLAAAAFTVMGFVVTHLPQPDAMTAAVFVPFLMTPQGCAA